MKVYVIVVIYKGMCWYDRCFSSLQKSSIPIQIVVVDNSPGELDAEYIREKFPDVIIIKPNNNIGFGRGNNLAIKYALNNNADYVFLLNQDTWLVDFSVIEKLIEISNNHTEYGILSPLHLESDGKTINVMFEHKNNNTSKSILIDLYKNELKEIYPTNYVNAAAWLLPRKTIESVGGFDPIFKLYGEDDDYLNRVIYHKLKIGVCPNLIIIHDHQTTNIPFTNDKKKYLHQQEILVNLNNVNYKHAPIRYLYWNLKKLIVSMIFLRRKNVIVHYDDIKFIICNLSRIIRSRLQNVKYECSWIE